MTDLSNPYAEVAVLHDGQPGPTPEECLAAGRQERDALLAALAGRGDTLASYLIKQCAAWKAALINEEAELAACRGELEETRALVKSQAKTIETLEAECSAWRNTQRVLEARVRPSGLVCACRRSERQTCADHQMGGFKATEPCRCECHEPPVQDEDDYEERR